MMSGLFARPGRLALILVLTLALLIALFPLRVAINWLGLADQGVAARSVRGPVWWGGIEELEVAGVRIGTVDAWLSPLALLTGRAKLGISRVRGLTDDIQAVVMIGPGQQALENVTGTVPLGGRLAPLPVTALDFTAFTVRFTAGACTEAKGRVRARLPGLATLIGLGNGLAGEARCEGQALLLPLASQSGQEQLDLRIMADGSYTATMRVTPADPTVGATLSAYGFAGSGGGLVLRHSGRF